MSRPRLAELEAALFRAPQQVGSSDVAPAPKTALFFPASLRFACRAAARLSKRYQRSDVVPTLPVSSPNFTHAGMNSGIDVGTAKPVCFDG